jgi:gliding motility associated protien GldN
MKTALKCLCAWGLLLGSHIPSMAQPNPSIMTESGRPLHNQPIDDITEKRLTTEKRVLPYDHVREADIFWEKRVWRVIDTREKMNLPFRYPERYFIDILLDAAKNGEITLYNPIDDKFTSPLTEEEVATIGASVDTIPKIDLETYEEILTVVVNELNPEDIKRFRVKEVWFFDQETSTMQVRILGIAPLKDETDDNGNFQYERVLFWVYYPQARQALARERAFNIGGNDASPVSWEDIFEMRFFSSYIYKESNVFNRRVEDYMSGIDILLEADKIKQEIFNFEQDLWSY